MGLLDKMKAAAGVGVPEMVVEVKQKPSKRGDDLVAVIKLTGGKQAFKLNYVVADVRWIGKWTIQSADGRPVNIDGHAIFYRQNQPGSETSRSSRARRSSSRSPSRSRPTVRRRATRSSTTSACAPISTARRIRRSTRSSR